VCSGCELVKQTALGVPAVDPKAETTS